MREWRQCPWCGRWFLATKRQTYDSKTCGAKYRYRLDRLEEKEELECLRKWWRRR